MQRVMERGVSVVLASGRAFPSMLPYAEELGTTAPVICYQGSKIVLPETGQVIYHATLPLPQTRSLLEYAQSRGLDATVYVDDHIYLRELRHPEEFDQRWFGLPRTVVEDLATSVRQEPTKILFIGEGPDNDRLTVELRERFGSHVRVVRSHELFVEVMALDASKGAALERVAEYLHVPQEQTMAVGDSENDVEMVAWAGLGVAMGNAVPQVKAVADYVAPPVDEDGAAVAIERFLLMDR